MTSDSGTSEPRASRRAPARLVRAAAVVALIGPALLGLARPPASFAADPPPTVVAGRCTTPPVVDGVLDDGEWAEATTLRFDVQMLRMKPAAAKGRRACELRVMSSANALYLLLRVPCAVPRRRFEPLEIDLATLAFCQGRDVTRGDDRKVLAVGVYADKHFTEPGKDADDAHADGRGAVGWEKGRYTFEWAVPLDAKDPEDLHARPGEVVGFNLAYLEGFRFDSEGTEVGALYGADFDHATTWGTLRLADRVKDDGGAAFAGPAWLSAAMRDPAAPAASALRLVEGRLLTGTSVRVGKADVAYSYRDTDLLETPAKGKIYVPSTVQKGGRVPLVYSAGYELDDLSAVAWVERGYAVATPAGLDRLPLARATNADTALLHRVRALPFVDDARVLVVGGSAGGWMALMLAAETFPLAGVAPDVAPVNWGYEGAYLLGQPDAITPGVPALFGIRPMVEPCRALYGADPNERTWHLHSPLAHVATITCPVSAVWSTADVLVPVDQIAARFVQPFDAARFPAGFATDPARLTSGDDGRRRLLDVLPEAAFEVFVVPTPSGAVRRADAKGGEGRRTVELPTSATRPWSIAIVDEGPPEPDMDHLKHDLRWTRDAFLKRWVTGKIAPEQLTAPKLERLMDRYADVEWLPTPLKHLDAPAIERADVLRGLATYAAASPEHARTFAALYAKLAPERQVLPADVVARLSATK